MSIRVALRSFYTIVVSFGREFSEYIRRNRWTIVLLLVLVFATYFIKLSNYSVSIDNEVALNDFDGLRKSWITIGRWALALMSYSINYTGYNSFFSTFGLVILFYVAMVLLSFYMSRLIKGESQKYEKMTLVIIGAICLTSPIFATMFNFSMQGIEVAAGLVVSILAAIMLDFVIFSRSVACTRIIYISVVLMLACSMGVYQSLAMVFVTVMVGFFLMRQLFDEKDDVKMAIIRVLKIIGIFVAAYALNVLVGRIVMAIFGIGKTDYLTSQITWGTLPFKESVKLFLIFVKNVVFPCGSLTGAYNYAYLYAVLLSVLLVIMLSRRLKVKALIPVMCVGAILVSPFLMALFGGNEVPPRTMLNLPVAIGVILAVFYYVTQNKYFQSGLLVMACLIGVTQFKTTADLFSSDLVRYEEDKILLQSVFLRIESMGLLTGTNGFSDKTLIFAGAHEILSTGVNARADAMGASFFSWDSSSLLGSNYRINGFAKTLGYRYVQPNVDEVEFARAVCSDSVKYPANDSIKSISDKIIICLE